MNRVILGLTGPTGAGKGEVDALLAAHGFAVIDTDALAHEVVAPDSDCLRGLVAEFSAAILHPNGTLDRAALAQRAFASPARQQRLNDLTHPYIIARSRGILEASPTASFVIDAPLLFESHMDAICTHTCAVLAPAALRRTRIMARDRLSAARASLRMNAQPEDAFYRQRATYILLNDGDRAALARQVEAMLQEVSG